MLKYLSIDQFQHYFVTFKNSRINKLYIRIQLANTFPINQKFREITSNILELI